ncbi:hypothetical protein CRYUN_Cryun37aG0078300 [Craigia yunnanensis]
MVATSFFYWALEISKFRHFIRLYIVTATSLIKKGNFDKANEVMQCLVRSFAEVGRLKEAVGMVFEMQNHGLKLKAETSNCILGVGFKLGLLNYLEKVFDEILFCDKGSVNRAFWNFDKMVKLGFKPNLINYSCLINGLCKRGSINQAFGKLEEMIREGWKPNVYVHTALIHGLCKKGWTEKAFRLFLKLVNSDNYKPNVHTYTSMISGYCNEEMLLSRMKEQGLVPNTITYTTLIDGHCKMGSFERA